MFFDLLDFFFDLRGYIILEKAAWTPITSPPSTKPLDAFPELPYQGRHGNVQRFDTTQPPESNSKTSSKPANPSNASSTTPPGSTASSATAANTNPTSTASTSTNASPPSAAPVASSSIHSGGHAGVVRNQFRFVNGKFRCGQCNIILALTDIGPGDGPTMIVPGSHKSNFPPPQHRHPLQLETRRPQTHGRPLPVPSKSTSKKATPSSSS